MTTVHLLDEDGEEIDAEGYEPVESEAWKCRSGTLVNTDRIEFPRAKASWGEICGVRVEADEELVPGMPLVVEESFSMSRRIGEGLVLAVPKGGCQIDFDHE